jgi:hypothetical protein
MNECVNEYSNLYKTLKRKERGTDVYVVSAKYGKDPYPDPGSSTLHQHPLKARKEIIIHSQQKC